MGFAPHKSVFFSEKNIYILAKIQEELLLFVLFARTELHA